MWPGVTIWSILSVALTDRPWSRIDCANPIDASNSPAAMTERVVSRPTPTIGTSGHATVSLDTGLHSRSSMGTSTPQAHGSLALPGEIKAYRVLTWMLTQASHEHLPPHLQRTYM